MAKTIVILGGSYGGLHAAHYLLKQKIPDVKVVIVSKASFPVTTNSSTARGYIAVLIKNQF